MVMTVRHPLSPALFKFLLTNRHVVQTHEPDHVFLTSRSSQLLCFLQEMAHRKQAIFNTLPTTIEGDARSHFKKYLAHYGLTSLDRVRPEAAQILLKKCELSEI